VSTSAASRLTQRDRQLETGQCRHSTGPSRRRFVLRSPTNGPRATLAAVPLTNSQRLGEHAPQNGQGRRDLRLDRRPAARTRAPPPDVSSGGDGAEPLGRSSWASSQGRSSAAEGPVVLWPRPGCGALDVVVWRVAGCGRRGDGSEPICSTRPRLHLHVEFPAST
jgi:hypothetical protein